MYRYRKDVSHDDHGEVEIFENYLRERGLKLTSARRDLLRLIFDNHGHFTADELFDQCRDADLRVSKATLYRTLTILLDCKLLAAYDFGEGARYYEHVYGHHHHDHVFCMVCKRISEFHSDAIERIQDEAAAELGYVPISHNLSIFGVCTECATTKDGQKMIAERDLHEPAAADEASDSAAE